MHVGTPSGHFCSERLWVDIYRENYFYRAGGQVECRRLEMEVSPFNVWKYQGGQIRTKSNKYKGKAKSPLILISSFSHVEYVAAEGTSTFFI